MRKFLISGAILAYLGPPAVAQDGVVFDTPKVDETTITITATGTRSEVEDTGQAVTVFGEEDIASVQGPDLTRLLRRAPGVTIARNGGVGAVTAVRVRGAQAEQLLTIIDGVRLADPASPNGGFDYGNLLTGNLAKVELLRGSNSTIWGSDAIGGVLVATTRAASDLAGSVEYGARDSFAGSASGGIGTDAGFLGASGSYYRTDGFSAAENGVEADGFEQYAVSSDGRIYLSDQLELFARGRYADGVLDIDGFPAPAFALADTPEVQETQQLSGAAGVVYDGGPIFVAANYSFADTDRQNFAAASRDAETFTSEGRSDRVELRGEWRPIGPLIVNFGAENEWTQYRTAFDAGEDTRILGAYTQLGIEFGGLSAHVGGRVDDHRRFGTATSFGADVSYEVVPDLRLRASVGEGFKAPTLFQLFSDFGNEALEPERSTGFDLGVFYGTVTLRAGATLFRRDSEQLISFIGCFGNISPICDDRPFGTYDNTGRTRAEGLEIEVQAQPVDGVSLGLAYAYIDTEDRSIGTANQGNRLARQPRHAATLTADYAFGEGLFDPTVGVDVRYVSAAFDNAANTVTLDDYAVFDLRAVLPVLTLYDARTVDLFARVENVTDSEYQTAAGYASPGRGVFVGVRTGL